MAQDGGRSHREAGAAFKSRIPAPISAFTRANIMARGTGKRLGRGYYYGLSRNIESRPLTFFEAALQEGVEPALDGARADPEVGGDLRVGPAAGAGPAAACPQS